MSARIGTLDLLLIDALREGDALKIAALRAELDDLLEKERRVALTNVAKCMMAEHFIPADFFNVGLN